MKFNVILCPKCKTAKGVVSGSKSSKCNKCGRNINLMKAKVLAKVDFESELAKVVGMINMKIHHGEQVFQMDLDCITREQNSIYSQEDRPHNRYDKIAGLLGEISGKDNKIVEAVKLLHKTFGDFSEDDFFEVLTRIGVTDSRKQEDLLKRLLENDVLYQPKIGVYRYLGN